MNITECQSYLLKHRLFDRDLDNLGKKALPIINEGFGYFGWLPKDIREHVLLEIIAPKSKIISVKLIDGQMLTADNSIAAIVFNIGGKFFIVRRLNVYKPIIRPCRTSNRVSKSADGSVSKYASPKIVFRKNINYHSLITGKDENVSLKPIRGVFRANFNDSFWKDVKETSIVPGIKIYSYPNYIDTSNNTTAIIGFGKVISCSDGYFEFYCNKPFEFQAFYK